MKRTDGPFLVYEILPGQVYQRGKLHSLATPVKFQGLDHYGIHQAVALAPTRPDPDLVTWRGYQHHPIPDGRLSEHGWLLDTAHDLAESVDRGDGAVLTMCNAGRNRSGLLSALLVRELTGLPGRAAIGIVRRHRPNALANDHFTTWLETLP